MPTASREVRLASLPHGSPTAENFVLATVDVPAPGDGQVLVRNRFFSVDPYMRGRMHEGWSWRNVTLGPTNRGSSSIPTFAIGEPLDGAAVGEVIASRATGLAAGDVVVSRFGWREYFVADAAHVQKADREVQPVSSHLGVLGVPGLTAWVGLKLAGIQPGERVFISSAAGAVGTVASQLAKIAGCYVIGSTGSDRKQRVLLEQLGLDAALNYRSGNLLEQLTAAAPDGIDVYFDNVGGEHLEAALAAMRQRGRVAVSGAISQYNAETAPPGPRNLFLIVMKGITIHGFRANDYPDETPIFLRTVGRYVADGTLKTFETIVDGIEQAPQAFIDMLRGQNIGKMLVKLA